MVLEVSWLVSQAAVISRIDKQGNAQLVGYVVPAGEFDREGIQGYLKEHLPEYMVPAYIIELTSFPLTANGKIDRRALPDPEGLQSSRGYTGPQNETEAKLAAIWEEVLELEKVGITDDFFEIGGHSLLAVRLVSAIRNGFGIELPINDVFVYPTIAGLIDRIGSENIAVSPFLIPIKVTGSKMPLYIVCGSGGTVLKFASFAKMLDPDQPVYGLQQPTTSDIMEGLPSTSETISEMYVKELLKQNPHGPYALSGHCFGGTIAIEMANELKKMGKTVSLLALFDVYTLDEEDITPAAIDNYYHIPAIVKRLFSKILLKTKFEMFLLFNHPKAALQYKTTKLKSIMHVNETKQQDNIEIEFNKVTHLFKIASRSYKMKYYEGEILAFYAKEKHYFTDWNNGILFKRIIVSTEKKYSWKNYAKSVKVYEVEGEHSTMFAAENATEFARILQQHLDESLVTDDKKLLSSKL